MMDMMDIMSILSISPSSWHATCTSFDQQWREIMCQTRKQANLKLNEAEKLTLPFVPVCDLFDGPLPFLPGSKTIELNFQPKKNAAKSAEGLPKTH